MKLIFESCHVLLCYDLRVNLVLDRIVFSWKSECIPSHWIEYVVSLHSSLSSYNIKCCVRSRMTYVKSLS